MPEIFLFKQAEYQIKVQYLDTRNDKGRPFEITGLFHSMGV